MFPELTRDDVFRLETRRLWLRWPRIADSTAILRLAGEKAVAQWAGKLSARLDFAENFAALADVYYAYDGNQTRLTRDDAEEPLRTGGVVPGWVLACWGELQAAMATTGIDSRAATAVFLLMPAA